MQMKQILTEEDSCPKYNNFLSIVPSRNKELK